MSSGRTARLATLALLLGGCVDNDVSFSISRFIGPNDECIIDPSVEIHRSRGTYDVSIGRTLASGYIVSFVIESFLRTVTTQPVQLQAYYVNSYDIELEPEGAAATAIPPSRRSFNVKTGTIRLDPGGNSGASVEAIQPDLAAMLDALPEPLGQVSIRLRAVATRAEEERVSAWSSFPVTLCRGCLAGNADASGNFPACPLAKGSVPADTGCFLGQDEPYFCCASGTSLICPAVVSTM
jgi:hypothetical protein